jgi:hypothetical protein
MCRAKVKRKSVILPLTNPSQVTEPTRLLGSSFPYALTNQNPPAASVYWDRAAPGLVWAVELAVAVAGLEGVESGAASAANFSRLCLAFLTPVGDTSEKHVAAIGLGAWGHTAHP